MTRDEIIKSVELKKWDKAKAYLNELDRGLKENQGIYNFKRLESMRGFFCHLAMTYELIFLFLKGFHLSLSAHFPGRDKEGWKMD